MTRTPARDRIMDAAARRFYASGITATGIDTVTADAGVAKMSLYNNFASKADLVDAYLDARHRELLLLFERRADAADSPAAACLALFDAYLDHAVSAPDGGFRGCGLLNAAAEFPAGHPARRAVRDHKEEIEAILRDHLETVLPHEEAVALAEHLAYLLEGCMARAGLEADIGRIERGRAIAETLLRDALPGSREPRRGSA